MLSTLTKKLNQFRSELHLLFPKRKDAIMNLIDALCSTGHQCKSVVQLSTSPHFERQYSSVTDAIADGLSEARWKDIRALSYQYVSEYSEDLINFSSQKNDAKMGIIEQKRNLFILDCTPQPRPYAPTLQDKHITHMPNPTPGNKPICVGHQYSVVAVAPSESLLREKHWIAPASVKRVLSGEKGNELGIKQLNECIDEINQGNTLNLSVADSLYGTPKCREFVVENENLVHMFRLRNDRNVFLKPKELDEEEKLKKGRKQEYGAKMTLSKLATHIECNESLQLTVTTPRGKTRLITVRCWRDILLRGTAEFRSSQHPINLIQITVADENNQPLYKRPLWLGILGKRRHEVTLEEAQQAYAQRYDIEHFNRFGKQNLLMAANQTPDVQHEELWWQLCCLAYIQLYLASGIVPSIPQPWERYLPEYKGNEDNDKTKTVSSPAKTQRGFATVLDAIGTPAAKCVPRGNPQGRTAGETQPKRERHNIIFKTKKAKKPVEETNVSGAASKPKNPNPQTIDTLLESVQSSLKQLNLTPTEFSKLLANTS